MSEKFNKSKTEQQLRINCSEIASKLFLARQLKDTKGVAIYKARLRSKQKQLAALVEKRPLKGGDHEQN
jgi:hypothetical protein